MASALRTLTEDGETTPKRDAHAVVGVRQLCFLPGGFGGETGDNDLKSLPISVQTHPSTEERIANLRSLEAEN